MAQFSVNAQRFDPYKNFKFRVKWDGKYVAGISKVGALKRTTEPIEHRTGGDPSTVRKSPGQTKYEAITLERGVTHDVDFEQWANKVWNFGSGLGSEVSLKDFRKDITLEVYNEAGQLAIAYNIYRCWVSEYQAMPDLDASGKAIAIQHIKLENEGWERDYSVVEPRGAQLHRTFIKVISMHALTDGQMLQVWEAGENQHPLDRALTLLGAACPERTQEELARLSIGQRDTLLFGLHRLTLGPRLKAFSVCPACGEELEFDVSTDDLLAGSIIPKETVMTVKLDEYDIQFRLPCSLDLAEVVNLDPAEGYRILLRRCILRTARKEQEITPEDLPEGLTSRIVEQMDKLDPLSEVRMDLKCFACGQHWTMPLDILSFFWTELGWQVKHIFGQVNLLARAYGWSEKEILSLSPRRRQQYIDLVMA